VAGDPADEDEWPWFVSLHAGGSHFCGGTLVRPDVVLTAAHCIAYEDGSQDDANTVTVYVNSYRLDDVTNGIFARVTNITVHPDYDYEWDYNDIAVLKLDRCIQGIKPLKMDTRDEATLFQSLGDEPSALAAIIGHGATQEGGGVTNILQEAVQTVLNHTQCVFLFETNEGGGNWIDADMMICGSTFVGVDQQRVDTCQGDSGGPFVTMDDGEFVLTGITSWGMGCAGPTPGVYARVASYMSGFIADNTQSSCTVSPTPAPTQLQPTVAPTSAPLKAPPEQPMSPTPAPTRLQPTVAPTSAPLKADDTDNDDALCSDSNPCCDADDSCMLPRGGTAKRCVGSTDIVGSTKAQGCDAPPEQPMDCTTCSRRGKRRL